MSATIIDGTFERIGIGNEEQRLLGIVGAAEVGLGGFEAVRAAAPDEVPGGCAGQGA